MVHNFGRGCYSGTHIGDSKTWNLLLRQMSAQGVHVITEMFEKALCDYTGAPYAIAVDNESNALAMCLTREFQRLGVIGMEVMVPSRTYPSVPAEVILAGGRVTWWPVEGETITGMYRLSPLPIWDSALRFTADMYVPGQLMCVSFTGAYKHLKLGKGGAILLDDKEDREWFIRARNSGRGECSYHVDNFTMLGKNYYMMPSVAALGLQLMGQFYNLDGTKKQMPDITLPYPDLSKFDIYNK